MQWLVIFLGVVAVLLSLIPSPKHHSAPDVLQSTTVSAKQQNQALVLPAPPALPQQPTTSHAKQAPLQPLTAKAMPEKTIAPLNIKPLRYNPKPQAKMTQQPIKPTAAQGQLLLAAWEKGEGASIQIRWPGSAKQRNQLYQFLHCQGVRSGLIASDGTWLAGENDTRFNAAKHSAMVRIAEGILPRLEQQRINKLRQQAQQTGSNARLFPRHMDARLMAGLHQLGVDLKSGQIHGNYQLKNNHLIIDQIYRNNKPIKGKIQLDSSHYCHNS